METGKYPFVMCNFAPPDMVGHTGVYDAAVIACTVTGEWPHPLARTHPSDMQCCDCNQWQPLVINMLGHPTSHMMYSSPPQMLSLVRYREHVINTGM